MTTTTTIKELVIHSGRFQCMVDVTEEDTFESVRSNILEEFDEDMLPCPESPSDFFISIGNIRLSRKQEARKKAWDVIKANMEVRIQAKKQPVVTASSSTNNNESSSPVKRPFVETNETAVIAQNDEDHCSKKIRSSDGNGVLVDHNSSVSPDEKKTGSETEQQTKSHGNDIQKIKPTAATITPSAPKNNSGATMMERDVVVDNNNKNSSTPATASPTSPLRESLSSSGDTTVDMSVHDCTNEDDPDPVYYTPAKDDVPDSIVYYTPENKESSSDKAAGDKEGTKELDTLSVEQQHQSENGTKDKTTTDHHVVTNDSEDAIRNEIQLTKTTPPPENDLHAKYDNAVASSRDVLEKLADMLQQPDNADFCNEVRKSEWAAEIANSLKSRAPDTIVGVLGNTGVGKSSLLNALLDEANVLPTSGSRGCTAAVVELRFNRALLEAKDIETTVYKGQVEFISLQDWLAELKLLLDECSTNSSQLVYLIPPMEERDPEAAAAWAKINQVYGQGTMEKFKGQPKQSAWQRLSTDRRVVNLLTGIDGQPNTILVEEGKADEAQSKLLCKPLSILPRKMRRAQKQWAGAFRDKINDYVYRKGNGGAPQTWPLIRKVVLHGPWAVLSTGACLVDLPGVRDANAARARVAQTYLQNCNLICVVAPIQRAVDDGSAKELMGEQFKRRLLMDGQYGNVMFICTQTDSCEATEILRDHADVAQQVPGRYERMSKMQDDINSTGQDIGDLEREEEDLKVELEDVNQEIKDLERDIGAAKKAAGGGSVWDDSDDDVEIGNRQAVAGLEAALKEKRALASGILEKLKATRDKVKAMQDKLDSKQRTLKAIAASVRNEYSTKCLQKDFKAGLEELINNNDGDNNAAPLPDDYQLEVHCICANDYLKIQGIKSATDGKAGTFSRAEDTNIPSLRDAVHRTTARFRQSFSVNFAESTSDMLDRIKLCATQDKEDDGSGHRFHKSFEHEMNALEKKLEPIVSSFIQKAEKQVNSALQPSLASGAKKGSHVAMSTVTSWGSKSRRSKYHRSPDANGLYWATYNATVRRQGVFVSGSAGPIDMNQELCDPVEKEFSSDWQRIMDGALAMFLQESERLVMGVFTKVAQDLVNAFAQAGMDRSRLQAMANTANRTCATAIRVGFEAMRKLATDSQRDLNRSLLPKITERMLPGYHAAEYAPGGPGVFERMKTAMHDRSKIAVKTMFNETISELLCAISGLIKQLARNIMAMSQTINKSLLSVYSVAWENKAQVVDPVIQERIRTCRNKLLPLLVALRKEQDTHMSSLGIEREDVEFDIVGVESWEQKKAKEMKEAAARGNYFEILSSDDEDETENRKPAPMVAARRPRVKCEEALLSSDDEDEINYFKPVFASSVVRPGVKWETDSS